MASYIVSFELDNLFRGVAQFHMVLALKAECRRFNLVN